MKLFKNIFFTFIFFTSFNLLCEIEILDINEWYGIFNRLIYIPIEKYKKNPCEVKIDISPIDLPALDRFPLDRCPSDIKLYFLITYFSEDSEYTYSFCRLYSCYKNDLTNLEEIENIKRFTPGTISRIHWYYCRPT